MTNRENGDTVEVEIPGYRVDIDREVDLIEEIARIRGYDRIGTTMPSAGRVGEIPRAYAFRGRLRDALVQAGLREVRLLPFASDGDITFTGDQDAIPVSNPLQADQGWLRTRLTPGLLHAASLNRARGVDEVAIFEVGTVFRLADPVQERPKAAFVLHGRASRSWAEPERPFDVLDAKGIVEALMLGLAVSDWALTPGLAGPFHPGRSAFISVGGERAGIIGELHPARARGMELEGRVAVVELEVEALMAASDFAFTIADVPRFPPVRRDLAFIVGESVPAGDVEAQLREAAGALLGDVMLFDVFRGGSLEAGTKSLAFALDFRAPDRTLTGEEADAAVAAITAALARAFGAELRAG
jgi:phenylalanyl-tRNA synthetase beta chain